MTEYDRYSNMHKKILHLVAFAAFLVGGHTLQAADSELGAWTLKVDGQTPPSAILDFRKALYPPIGEPEIDSLDLSCGAENRIVYRLKSKLQQTKLSHQEGEEFYEFHLKSGGIFPPQEATRFVKLIMPLIKSYEDLKQKRQLIDLSGGEFDFYGFTRVRAAMKDACARERAVPSTSPASDTSQSASAAAGALLDKDAAEKAVMMMLYGVTKWPYIQTVNTEVPFNRYQRIVRTVNISKFDSCRYSISSDVTHSDVPLVATVGKHQYDIDFSKIGAIDVGLADNAYEAFAWDPMMVVYPAQKEMVKRHIVSKVVKVTLNMAEEGAFCVKYQDHSKPDRCGGSKSFEVNPQIASPKRISNAVNFFKEKICQGKPF